MTREVEFETMLALFQALNNEAGLRLVALLRGGPRSLPQLAQELGFPPRRVEALLGRLKSVELVEEQTSDGQRQFALRVERLRAVPDDLLHMAPPSTAPRPAPPPGDFDAKTLHDFMVDGRLKSIPMQRKKRDAVLRYLASLFEPGRRYPEREVNDILRAVHPDSASLRRELVDGRWMARERGIYWRIDEHDA